MHQTINRSQSHSRILEDFAPFAERLICRDENGAPFVASADKLEQHGRFGLIFGNVNQIIDLCVAQRKSMTGG
jgi:hypothetical protein